MKRLLHYRLILLHYRAVITLPGDYYIIGCNSCGYAEHLRGGSCPALGQRCNKCNAKGHFASVYCSKRNTVNFERLKAYEV